MLDHCQKQDMGGKLQFNSHLMLMECVLIFESLQLKGSSVGDLL